MKKILGFVKREPVLVAAALAAGISCFFVVPDKVYLSYIDFRTLALLYSLMTVIAGFRKAGLFDRMALALCRKSGQVRLLGILLVLMCFVSSMLITNDVALLTFVPFTFAVLSPEITRRFRIPVVVLETVAANLGSMLTPVGNPQNLYLYSFYGFSIGSFLSATFPFWILSLFLILLLCLFLPRERVGIRTEAAPEVGKYNTYNTHFITFKND